MPGLKKLEASSVLSNGTRPTVTRHSLISTVKGSLMIRRLAVSLSLIVSATSFAENCLVEVRDAVKCGGTELATCTKEVTDEAECGLKKIKSASKCGTETVTDGAACGWDNFTSVAKCGAECVGSLAQAYAALEQGSFQLCITDMRLPDGEGIDLVRHIGGFCSDLPVAVITAFGSADSAVAALKAGAFDYVSKPVSLDQLRGLVKSALDIELHPNQGRPGEEPQLLGEAPAMQQARALIDRVARSQAPVHITGESGTGKELAARRIHALGGRAKGPFVPVNCGAIPETLMESEFFGYRNGAFTGA